MDTFSGIINGLDGVELGLCIMTFSAINLSVSCQICLSFFSFLTPCKIIGI